MNGVKPESKHYTHPAPHFSNKQGQVVCKAYLKNKIINF